MHGNQWNDFDLDYQLADPMESNHYLQGRIPLFVLLAMGFMLIWIGCKTTISLFTYI